MASKYLSTDSISLTEKKMVMSLEDIIKMSKKNAPTKGKGQRPLRVPNKRQGFRNGCRSQANSHKVQNFLNSKPSIRQGVLARKRSSIPGSQFSLTKEAARRSASAPIQNMGINSYRPRAAPMLKKDPSGKLPERANFKDMAVSRQRQTLDARFADMKEQRMRVMSRQIARGGFNVNASRRLRLQRRRQQQRARRGAVPVPVRDFGRY